MQFRRQFYFCYKLVIHLLILKFLNIFIKKIYLEFKGKYQFLNFFLENTLLGSKICPKVTSNIAVKLKLKINFYQGAVVSFPQQR